MNDGSFESTNPKYPDCNNLINNKYNMKFVDKYGMNEVVVTPNKDLSGMSNSQIEKYLDENLKKLNNTTSQIYNYWNENYF